MPDTDENKPTPTRKLLALDGGGIRGVLTLEVLAELESQLRSKLTENGQLAAGAPFVLADYFDYVAGTSTGAIIATCLSLGMAVADIRDFYVASGPAMFDKASLLKRFRYNYDDTQLAAKLRDVIRQYAGRNQQAGHWGPNKDIQGQAPDIDQDEIMLGSPTLRTYLMLVLRNATTDSPWPLSNNPGAMYNALARSNCNLRLPLWQLVRASTAAPTYFPPQKVAVGGQDYLFVDGGVTMYNNPAFQLFLMATLKPYKLEWPVGEKNMLLVSVGTGAAANANADLQPSQMNLLYNASSIPSALMFAAANEQDLLCRVFGRCLHGADIDREVLDLKGDIGPGSLPAKHFTYLRYNADLSPKGLQSLAEKNPDVAGIKPENVQQMDSVKYIDQLQRVGRAVAGDINMAHFAGFLGEA